jgi:hypothetical protein
MHGAGGHGRVSRTVNATKIEEAQGARQRMDRLEPPWNVVVHDSWHPMSWGVYALVGATPARALRRWRR